MNDYHDDQDTKNKIFNVAARLFSDKGYHGVSMREISEVAGVTKPTIYYYFGNKEGVYKNLVDEGIKYITKNSQNIMELDASAKRKLVKLIQYTFQQCVKYPELTKFFINLFDSAENLTFLNDFRLKAEQYRQVWVKLIEEGIHTGEFGVSAKPLLASEIIGGVFIHFIRKQLNNNEIMLSDELAEDIVELLFRGLNE